MSAVAARYPGVSGSQVSLKYLVQHAQKQTYYAGVIPKSDNPAHLASNIDLFHFNLSQADMALLANATEPAAEAGDCDAP